MKLQSFPLFQRKYRMLIWYSFLLILLCCFTTLHIFVLQAYDPTIEHSVLGVLELFSYFFVTSNIYKERKYRPGSGIITTIKINKNHVGINKTMEQLSDLWNIQFWRINKKEKHRHLTDVTEYTIEYWDKKRERLIKK